MNSTVRVLCVPELESRCIGPPKKRDDCFSTGASVFYGLLLRTAASSSAVLPKVTLEGGIVAERESPHGLGIFGNFHVWGGLSEGQQLLRTLYTFRSQTTSRVGTASPPGVSCRNTDASEFLSLSDLISDFGVQGAHELGSREEAN